MTEADGEKNGELKVIASRRFKQYDEMYMVVDFLNKSLKDRKVMFGLNKDGESGMLKITIYEI